MIDLRNVMSPIETANGLPNACYVDDAMFTHERNTLFRDSWAAIGFGKDIPRPGMVKNRDQLMDAAYGESVFLDDRTIDSHIKRLRRKIKAQDSSFDHIETLYGIGYKYRAS